VHTVRNNSAKAYDLNELVMAVSKSKYFHFQQNFIAFYCVLLDATIVKAFRYCYIV